MKVIHCLNHFLPQRVAGTEVYTAALVKELLEKDIEAIVLIPNYQNTITETYWYENIKVIKYAEPSVVNRDLITGKTIPEGLCHFKKVIELEKPSVVHFHVVGGSNGITLHHVKVVKQLGIKIILTFHLVGYTCKTGNLLYKNKIPCDGVINIKKCTQCVYVSKNINGFKKSLLFAIAVTFHSVNYNSSYWNNSLGTAIALPFQIDDMKKKLVELSEDCDKIVVLTQWYKKILELNGVNQNKLVHIPQGLPFHNVKRSIKNDTTVIELVFIGRINASKGLHLLIKALQHFSDKSMSLSIYGQADDELYLADCKALSQGMENIHWKGLLLPGRVVETLSQFDCLCVPSIICEMSPLVIQEAFAAGIPVIASNVPGNSELIRHEENGLLFQAMNEISLKKQLLRCATDPNLLKELKKNISAPRSFVHIADSYIKIYKGI